MDLLAKAYARAHYARQIPISPKIKPPTAAAAALVAIASSAPAHVRAESYVRHLPGLAPWREESRGRRVIAPVPRLASIKEIISVVANELGVTSEQIRGNYRTRKYTFPRHVAQYLAQRVTRQSLPIISRIFFSAITRRCFTPSARSAA